MLISRLAAVSCSVGLMVFGAATVSGQDYPDKPIRIMTSGIGGNGDFASRLIGQGLTDSLGQQVIVDNRGGSSIPSEIVQKAPPDGYTLLLDGGSFWIGPLLRATSYDPIRDFSAITTVTTSPNLLVVHASVAANSVKELIALAKAKPGALNYASGGVGGSSHLAAELFKSMAGSLDIVRVNYKGTGAALSAVLSGEAQVMLIPAAGIGPNLKSDKVKVLAVTGAQRSPAFPELPTMAEAGVPGYEASVLQGVFAPAKTPAPVINRLNQEIVRILNRADVREKFSRTGQDAFGSTPQQFTATIKSEIAKWGRVTKEAGIKVE